MGSLHGGGLSGKMSFKSFSGGTRSVKLQPGSQKSLSAEEELAVMAVLNTAHSLDYPKFASEANSPNATPPANNAPMPESQQPLKLSDEVFQQTASDLPLAAQPIGTPEDAKEVAALPAGEGAQAPSHEDRDEIAPVPPSPKKGGLTSTLEKLSSQVVRE